MVQLVRLSDCSKGSQVRSSQGQCKNHFFFTILWCRHCQGLGIHLSGTQRAMQEGHWPWVPFRFLWKTNASGISWMQWGAEEKEVFPGAYVVLFLWCQTSDLSALKTTPRFLIQPPATPSTPSLCRVVLNPRNQHFLFISVSRILVGKSYLTVNRH